MGFAPDLGDDGGIDVGRGVADFHLDELDGLFNSLADSTWRRRRVIGRRRIAAHTAKPHWGAREEPTSSVSGWVSRVNRGGVRRPVCRSGQ